MAAPGDREPNDIHSFLSGPGFRILLGAATGHVAARLFNRRQCVLDSKLAQLNSAPTIPISSLKTHEIPREGKLVVIENGQVCSLSSLPAVNYKSNESRRFDYGAETVVSKTLTYTSEPREFKRLFNGGSSVHVYRVPFALVEGKMFGRGCFVIVNNVDTDHLKLEDKGTTAAPLEPPVKLTKEVLKDEIKKHEIESKMEICRKSKESMSSTIEVYKMTKESVLQSGTRLESVFGRLSARNGMAEIEPCPNFPKACFTMRRDEIKKTVRDEVYGSVYPSRVFGVGLGLVSFGLLFSGFISYCDINL